jgi:hypothetical protein
MMDTSKTCIASVSPSFEISTIQANKKIYQTVGTFAS